MIIARTPLRISFLGGGTDYPEYFEEHGGQVLATAINKYSYITVNKLNDFFDHRIRLSYSKTELVHDFSELNHPAVREVLRLLEVPSHLELNCISDLPARTGLGSSSSFVVCLLHALMAYKGKVVSNEDLAMLAIQIEKDILKENVGCQDQVICAVGGLKHVTFLADRKVSIDPVIASKETLNQLESSMFLVYTGLTRSATEIAKEQVERTSINKNALDQLKNLVIEGRSLLQSSALEDFGRLLHEGWLLKKSFSSKIANTLIDEMYDTARSHGALGGKLLGAGGGGFLLIFSKPEHRANLISKFEKFKTVMFNLEQDGSRIIHYNP